jgi:hypothetical protein
MCNKGMLIFDNNEVRLLYQTAAAFFPLFPKRGLGYMFDGRGFRNQVPFFYLRRRPPSLLSNGLLCVLSSEMNQQGSEGGK